MIAFDFSLARRNMVEGQIRPNRVRNARIIDAFLEVPREVFVPESLRALSYTDSNIRLPGGRVLMSPLLLARLLEAAEIAPSDRILDVACATGYSTAIMARLADDVVGYESDHVYANEARHHLVDMGLHHATAAVGALQQGPSSMGFFDVIIFQGLVDKVPHAYYEMLAPRGRIVAVVGAHERLGRAVLLRQGSANPMILFEAALPSLSEFVERKSFVFS